MARFFVKENQIIENEIFIKGNDVNHIKNVLRYQIGDELIVVVESKETYLCEIIKIENQKIITQIKEKIDEKVESNLHINIIQGLPKADKMELVIQKCTELGVKEFTPLQLKRCIVKLEEKEANKKIERWKKIAEVAAKQCGRENIPVINTIYSVSNIFDILQDYDIILLAYEGEKQNTLKEEIKKIQRKNEESLKVAIIIGPEGGLEEKEVEILKEKGAKVITLGNRILRTETVAFVITSILMYEWGDIG